MGRLNVAGNTLTLWNPSSPAGTAKAFQLKDVQSSAVQNGKHYHVAGIRILFKAAVHQIAAGNGVNGADLFSVLTVNLVRDKSDPATTMIPNVQGDMLWLMAQDSRGGFSPVAPPANIPLSGGAADTAAFAVLPIYFEDLRLNEVDQHQRIWPLAAFANGELKVTVAPIAQVSGDANLTYNAASENSLDYELILVPKDQPEAGQNVVMEVVNDPSNAIGTSGAIPIDEGSFARVIYYPFGWGGLTSPTTLPGNDCIGKVTQIDSLKGGQAIAFPGRSGAQFRDDWFERGHHQLIGNTTSLLANGRALELKGIAPGRSLFSEVFNARKKWKLAVTVSSPMASPHRFLVIRYFTASAAEDRRIADNSNISGPVTVSPVSPTGRLPTNTKRNRFLRRQIMPGGGTAKA